MTCGVVFLISGEVVFFASYCVFSFDLISGTAGSVWVRTSWCSVTDERREICQNWKLLSFGEKKKGEIDLQLAFNDQRMLDVWGPVGFVIALSQGCLVLGQVISMIGWYLGGLIDYPDSRVLQATFQSYVQMFSSPTFSECIESRPSCCFTACNHNKSMPAAHINIAPKSTAKLKGGEWIWDPVPLTRVRSMHAERAVDDPAAGREHSWNHLSAGQLWSGETEVFSGETCLEWSWHLILMAVVLQCFTSFLSTRWGSRRKAS